MGDTTRAGDPSPPPSASAAGPTAAGVNGSIAPGGPSGGLEGSDAPGGPSAGVFALLLLCFFLSGLAALIYQTAWTRRFAFAFGTSELAVAAVLAAYMAGLAVGASVAARFVGRVRRPVLVYGVLEAAIAVSALCVPLGLDAADTLHAALFAVSGAPPAAGHAAHAIFTLTSAFAVLFVPTGLMGATLPLLAREAVHRERDVGPRIAVLYAMNTAGAVCGTLLAGFWLLPSLGLSGTVWVAVSANVVVFVAAAAVGVREPATEPDGAGPGAVGKTMRATTGALGETTRTTPGAVGEVMRPPPGARFDHRWVLPVMLISGTASFCYEVLWTRMLGHVLGGSVYAFATMLASFLTGIALGSALSARFSRDARSASRALFACQVGIGALSVAAFLMVDDIPGLTRSIGAAGAGRLLADAAVCVAVLLPSTTLIGATFPLAVRLHARGEASAAAAAARVYAWNTVGAIAGALGAGFFLIPALGFERAVGVAAATNLGLAAFIALRGPGPAPIGARRIRAAIVATGALALLAVPLPKPARLLRTSPLQLRPAPGELAFEAVGQSASVNVVRRRGSFYLATNGLPEAAIRPPGGYSLRHFVSRWLGAGPTLARPDTRDMLVVGLGGGVLLEWLPPSLEEVYVIELEPEVVAANRAIAQRRGVDPLTDPRVSIILNDARGAMRLTDRRFDAIVSQPSHPWTAGASHLYTREFFALVDAHLEPGGVFVQWMGLSFIDEELFGVIVATLRDVFPHVAVYHPQQGGVVFLASREPIDLERSAPIAIAAAPGFFERAGFRDEVDIAGQLLLDESAANRLAARSAVGTDERNLLQMRSPALVRDGLDAFDPDDGGLEIGACDGTTRARTPSARLVQSLIASEHVQRAIRCATKIEAPAEHAYADAIVANAMGDTLAARRSATRALIIDPGFDAARLTVLATQSPWRTPPSETFLRSARALDPTSQPIVEGWSLVREREWDALSRLEGELAAIPRDHVAWAYAQLLRATWRVEIGDEAQAREAVTLADDVIAAGGRQREARLLRARAALAAGWTDATLESLDLFARFNSGARRDVTLAREALVVLDQLPEASLAPGDRAGIRRSLGAVR